MSSLADQDVLDVMAHLDGELEDEVRKAEIEALIASNADAKELILSMRALGDAVRATQPTGESAPKIDVTLAVMAKLSPNELDRARLAKQSRVRAFAVVATLGALAAGAWIYSQSNSSPDASLQAPVAVTPTSTAPMPTFTAAANPVALNPSAPLVVNETHGVQVDSLDTRKPVSVFYVSPNADNANASSSVVVWIDEPAPGAQTP